MSRRPYSRLCCLIHGSLHPFTGKSTVAVTKEQEKSLLIILSQVLNEIKLRIGEFDSDSGSDSDNGDHGNTLINISGKSECTADGSMCHSSASQCVFMIINDLVFLLAIESRYAQHLAGNVLVAVSEFVVASERYWDEFMQSLCFYLDLAICKVVSPSLDPQNRAKGLDCDSSAFKFDLQPVLNNASWYSVGGIVLVLRNVLKQRKHEDGVKLLEVYSNALGSCLRNIPWDLCNGIFIDNIAEVVSSSFHGDAFLGNNVRQPMSWFEFCGYLVQLFCSMVSQNSLPEAVADSPEKHPAIHEIFNILPKILAWCLGKQGACGNNTCISQYIRQKTLVLMIRLSSVVHLQCEMVVSWLHLINKHFQDLLFESVTQPEACQDDCLKDSPFLLSIADVEYNTTSHRHLQRRVVFLYLRSAFNLISLKERSRKQCLCGDPKSCSKKGFTALYEWLQKHLPADILVNSEFYSDRCKSFTKSFLQLYMHEDDMLFEVLLQLTYMPFGYEQQITEEWTSQVVEKNILFLLSDIFDPIHLFHLFLSELHYDHQVLLDYLISNDTGASCAEYLLRCLHIICDKWNSFLGFSFVGQVGNQSSCKRRKIKNDSYIQPELFSEADSDAILLSSKMVPTNQKTRKQPFQDAMDCLLLLKKSVENLHQKDLFPYNPQVLLRRLTRFEELCLRP